MKPAMAVSKAVRPIVSANGLRLIASDLMQEASSHGTVGRLDATFPQHVEIGNEFCAVTECSFSPDPDHFAGLEDCFLT